MTITAKPELVVWVWRNLTHMYTFVQNVWAVQRISLWPLHPLYFQLHTTLYSCVYQGQLLGTLILTTSKICLNPITQKISSSQIFQSLTFVYLPNYWCTRRFVKVFISSATGFHTCRSANVFDLNFFVTKPLMKMVKPGRQTRPHSQTIFLVPGLQWNPFALNK